MAYDSYVVAEIHLIIIPVDSSSDCADDPRLPHFLVSKLRYVDISALKLRS